MSKFSPLRTGISPPLPGKLFRLSRTLTCTCGSAMLDSFARGREQEPCQRFPKRQASTGAEYFSIRNSKLQVYSGVRQSTGEAIPRDFGGIMYYAWCIKLQHKVCIEGGKQAVRSLRAAVL